MSKAHFKPVIFSRRFGISDKALAKLGVFDPTLNADTLLFPDPTLLRASSHAEMRAAAQTFDHYFEMVRKLLGGSKGNRASAPWKAAAQRLRFPEIAGTCLGYGSGSIRGSGVGGQTRNRLLNTAYEIISLGIDDPDLFMAMGLFEEDFGPDLIGDMFTNVCMGEIIQFNKRVCSGLGLKTDRFNMRLANGMSFEADFVHNPTQGRDSFPVILLPTDILRDLPVALDWKGVQEVSEQNAGFRESLNTSVAAIWSRKTLESKDKLRVWAMSSRDAFGDLLDMVHGMDGKPYDFANDRLGELIWRTISERITSEYPKNIPKPSGKTADELTRVVDTIIAQFKHLIEDRDLWKELYTDSGQVRLEKAAQRLLYMTAISYCEANDIDISPEADTGRGPVDYKFSTGSKTRLLVELKLSTNTQVVKGFEKQLALYNKAEKTSDSRYVILNVGQMGKKLDRIKALRDAQIANGQRAPEVVVIDGLPKKSASKA